MNRREALIRGSALAAGLVAATHGVAAPGEALEAAIASADRSPANRLRDAYRRPLEALRFWGVRANMTLVDIEPGGGYWTEILAPYLRGGGGRYIAAIDGAPDHFLARFSDTSRWGQVTAVSLFDGPYAAPGTVDMILTTRNIHDWVAEPKKLDAVLAASHAALKPGAFLAVTDHRADPRAMLADASDGYVNTAWVVRRLEGAGFKLSSSSEINANPKDDKNHPFGVWTLPPTLRSHAKGQPVSADYDAAKYLAIGESDRMTLRFVKI